MIVFKIQINILIKLNQTLKNKKNSKTKKRILSKSWKGKVCEVMQKKRALKELLVEVVLDYL